MFTTALVHSLFRVVFCAGFCIPTGDSGGDFLLRVIGGAKFS